MENKSVLRKIIGLPLHWQILAAMLLGLISALSIKAGFYDGSAPVPGWVDSFVGGCQSLGALFMRLLRMVIVPLVASSIISGVASAGSASNLGRLGTKTFGFYLLTSFVAILIGLGLSNLIQPGVGVNIAPDNTFSPDSLQTPGSLVDILTRIIPLNPLQALVEADMLSIIFFSIVFGAALTRVAARHRDLLLPVIDGFFHTMMKLTAGVIRLAPIGVFGLIFKAAMSMEPAFFFSIGRYMITIAIGLSLHFFVALPLILWIFTKRNPLDQYRHMTAALLTAFSTSSSSATLPLTIECVEENVGVSNRISSFVLPLGSTVNMDGTALYECAGALFIAQVMGVDLNFSQQVLMVITALLASVGAAGIPSAGLVMIFIVLDAIGLKGDQVGVIVGAMLAIDRPLDMYRTVVNIFSDSVGATVIAHSEGELREQSKEVAA